MTPGQEHTAQVAIQDLINAGLPSAQVVSLVGSLVLIGREDFWRELDAWVTDQEVTIRQSLMDKVIDRVCSALRAHDTDRGLAAFAEHDRLAAGRRSV